VLILVSGPVRVGKTTLCMRLVERARECGINVAGVLTPALVEDGVKVGIQAVELASGETRLLARTDRDLGGIVVGPYSFDDSVLEWVAGCCERALAARSPRERTIVFVDEIGKLELSRGAGLARLIPLLAQPREQTTVVLVRDFLLDALVARLPEVEPCVVVVDAVCREQAWREVVKLALGGACDEAGRC
jgi:nucleoside-triphosphatase THEP1